MKRLLLISFYLCFAMTSNALELPQGIIALKAEPAGEFSITDIDNNRYQLSSNKGKWVFLHFWASWCGPCRKEMPVIYTLQQQLKDQPIDFILVNTSEDEDTIFAFLGSVAPDLHSYMDRDGELTETWAPRGLPTTYLIDPSGHKRYAALGGRAWDQVPYQNFVSELLKIK